MQQHRYELRTSISLIRPSVDDLLGLLPPLPPTIRDHMHLRTAQDGMGQSRTEFARLYTTSFSALDVESGLYQMCTDLINVTVAEATSLPSLQFSSQGTFQRRLHDV